MGDKLAKAKHPLAIAMSFRGPRGNISVDQLDPKPKRKGTLVLVHGLMADEDIWRILSRGLDKKYSVLFVRYNSQGISLSSPSFSDVRLYVLHT